MPSSPISRRRRRRTCDVARRRALSFPPGAARASCSRCSAGRRRARARGARGERAGRRSTRTRSLRRVATRGLAAADVVAAGVHGQTVRHRPDDGWTLQLNNRGARRRAARASRSSPTSAAATSPPAARARRSCRRFTRRSSAADAHRVVVNSAASPTSPTCAPGGAVRGFDTGPGNVLLDLWHARHRGGRSTRRRMGAHRARRRRAARRAARRAVLRAPPPKSTGRDLFNADWLDAQLAGVASVAPADVQATLVALTARTIADGDPRRTAPARRSARLRRRRAERDADGRAGGALAPRRVATTAAHGVAVEHVEALAFAWLAREALAGRAGQPAGGHRRARDRACWARSIRAETGHVAAENKTGPRGPRSMRRCDEAIRRRTTSRSRRWSWRSDS